MHIVNLKNGRESDAVMAHRPCNSINDVIFALRVYSKTHFGCNKLIRLKVTKKHTSSATQCVCPSKTNAHNPIERVGSSIKRRIERIKKQRDNIDTHSKRISTKAMMDVPFTWCTQSTGVFVCWIETERIKRWGIKRDASFVLFFSFALIQTFNSSDCRPYWCTVRNRLSFRWWTRRACVVVWRTRRE